MHADPTLVPMKRPAQAFTLIELLVVVAVISMLVAMLLPALSAARKSAIMTQCAAMLRGITQVSLIYSAENKDYLIAAWGGSDSPYGASSTFYYETLASKAYLGPNWYYNRFRCPDVDATTAGQSPYWNFVYPINGFVSLRSPGFPGTPRALRVEQVKSAQIKVFFGDGWGSGNAVGVFNRFGDPMTRRHFSNHPLVPLGSGGSDTNMTDRTANLAYIDGHGAFAKGDYLGRTDSFSNNLFYRENLWINAQGGNYP